MQNIYNSGRTSGIKDFFVLTNIQIYLHMLHMVYIKHSWLPLGQLS